MTPQAKGWTPERRKAQSEKIRQWQPWQHSTGAKTPEGKAISSRNAYKGGHTARVRDLIKGVNALDEATQGNAGQAQIAGTWQDKGRG